MEAIQAEAEIAGCSVGFFVRDALELAVAVARAKRAPSPGNQHRAVKKTRDFFNPAQSGDCHSQAGPGRRLKLGTCQIAHDSPAQPTDDIPLRFVDHDTGFLSVGRGLAGQAPPDPVIFDEEDGQPPDPLDPRG